MDYLTIKKYFLSFKNFLKKPIQNFLKIDSIYLDHKRKILLAILLTTNGTFNIFFRFYFQIKIIFNNQQCILIIVEPSSSYSSDIWDIFGFIKNKEDQQVEKYIACKLCNQ